MILCRPGGEVNPRVGSTLLQLQLDHSSLAHQVRQADYKHAPVVVNLQWGQWHSGTVPQWHSGTVAQWYCASVAQKPGPCYAKAKAKKSNPL